MKFFVFIISFSLLFSCKNSNTPLFKKDFTNEKERNNNLLVFVGELIQCVELPQDEGSMDAKFKAKFKILQTVYGEYAFDTIEFIAYDHYGFPQFSKYKNFLMFVSKHDGKYFHEKYQFHDVYKTKNGRWAGTVWCTNNDSNIFPHPEKIDFENTVNFPSIHKDRYGDDDDFPCGEPYYKLVGEKKIPVYGNYIEELFLEKKHGVLAARGIFEGKSTPTELIVEDMAIAETKKDEPVKKEDKFKNAYEQLFQSIIKKNLKEFKQLSLDEINVMDSIVFKNQLTDSVFNILFRENMLKKYTDFVIATDYWSKVDSPSLLKEQLLIKSKQREKSADRILIMSYNFYNKKSKKIAILFKKLNNQYKFFGYDSILFPIKTSNMGSYYVQ